MCEGSRWEQVCVCSGCPRKDGGFHLVHSCRSSGECMMCFEGSSPRTWHGPLWCVRDILDRSCLLSLGPEHLSQRCRLYPKEEAREAYLEKKSFRNWLPRCLLMPRGCARRALRTRVCCGGPFAGASLEAGSVIRPKITILPNIRGFRARETTLPGFLGGDQRSCFGGPNLSRNQGVLAGESAELSCEPKSFSVSTSARTLDGRWPESEHASGAPGQGVTAGRRGSVASEAGHRLQLGVLSEEDLLISGLVVAPYQPLRCRGLARGIQSTEAVGRSHPVDTPGSHGGQWPQLLKARGPDCRFTIGRVLPWGRWGRDRLQHHVCDPSSRGRTTRGSHA